ncbi:MAG: glycosyltransferase family 2 protein [Acetobacter sp.]|nr:glycosyltransferase family 2 protein [Acetobacter sp.]
MISVIIPHHEESIDLMNPCLSSLDMQQGIDFSRDVEILIINDSKEHIIQDFSKYKNIAPRIKQLFNEKKDYMGISRQIGIDNSAGDYVMFIDSDDMLAMPMVICDALSRTRVMPDVDVFCYRFYEETILPNGQYTYIDHPNDFTWMFAKVYKKSFLFEHNIKFHDDLLWHEDTYFNQLVLAYAPKIETLEYLVYLWHCTLDSITRRNSSDYTYGSLSMYIDAFDKLLDRTRMLFSGAQVLEKVAWLSTYIYCCLQRNELTDSRDSHRRDIEQKLSTFIKRWDPNLLLLAPEMMPLITDTIRVQATGYFLPTEGFPEFIKKLSTI